MEEMIEAKVVNINETDIDKNRWNVFLCELYQIVLKKRKKKKKAIKKNKKRY